MIIEYSINAILNFLQNHPFVKNSEVERIDFAGWVCQTMGLDPSTPTKSTFDNYI